MNIKCKYLPGDWIYCKFGKKYFVYRIITDGKTVEYHVWDGNDYKYLSDIEIEGTCNKNVIGFDLSLNNDDNG